MLRLLRRPQWFVPLLLLPLAMGLCLVAANWQYHRHLNRAADEQRLAAALQATPAALDSVLSPGQDLRPDQRYTAVSASGTFVADQTVLIRNRPLNSEPGFWVVTPLLRPDGSQIEVLRGWLAAEGPATEMPSVPAPPTGVVTVNGVLQPSEPLKGSAARGPMLLSLTTSTLCPEPTCFGAYLQAVTVDPADSLETLPVKGPGLGPHLGYAGQWVLFALMLPIGYLILLRREAKSESESVDALPTA